MTSTSNKNMNIVVNGLYAVRECIFSWARRVIAELAPVTDACEHPEGVIT